MKQVVVINGCAGVGKDTFVNCLSKYVLVQHISIVDGVKEVARSEFGWNGGKSEKERKFLNDLKRAVDEYNDGNFEMVRCAVRAFFADDSFDGLLCIDMRERKDIERAVKEFKAITVYIENPNVAKVKSNQADAEASLVNAQYDHIISNDGSIEKLQLAALHVWSDIEISHDESFSFGDYKKVIYVSHPYGGLEENKERVEKIILEEMKRYPDYLFLSPISTFGFKGQAISYGEGLAECLWLLAQSDEVWVYGDYENSRGCRTEIWYCEVSGTPYKIMGGE